MGHCTVLLKSYKAKSGDRNRRPDQLKEGLNEKVRHVTLPPARLYMEQGKCFRADIGNY